MLRSLAGRRSMRTSRPSFSRTYWYTTVSLDEALSVRFWSLPSAS
ncbi:hypothetical protein [Cystobacter ferrugineus]|nr:hypothetical protein [Cystobacter ferrugineus]